MRRDDSHGRRGSAGLGRARLGKARQAWGYPVNALAAARLAVWVRDSVPVNPVESVPTCRRCGCTNPDALVVHHLCIADRRRKVHDPARMVLVCQGPASNDCHGWIHMHPAEAYESGWLARSGTEGDLQERL